VNLSVKNVPEDLAERLRDRARAHHRSLQGELLALLEEAVTPGRLSVEDLQKRLRASGLKTAGDSARLVRELRDGRRGS